jgi:hypothetical protein
MQIIILLLQDVQEIVASNTTDSATPISSYSVPKLEHIHLYHLIVKRGTLNIIKLLNEDKLRIAQDMQLAATCSALYRLDGKIQHL